MDDNHWVFPHQYKNLNRDGRPAMTRTGRNMRKAVFEAVTGETPPDGAQPVKCPVRRCMNPMHITAWVVPGDAAS